MVKVGLRLGCLGSLGCCSEQSNLLPHSFTSSMRPAKMQRLNGPHSMSFKAEVRQIGTV